MSSSSLTDLERSEIEDLKEDLINSVSTEYSSLPSSPLSKVNFESFDLVTRTAPPSPIIFRDNLSRHRSVSNLISDFENRSLDSFKESRVAQTVKMAEVNEIKSVCTNLKRVITWFLNALKKQETDNTLDITLLELQKPKILSRIKELETKEMDLDAALNKAKVSTEDPNRVYGSELIDYISDSEVELARLCKKFESKSSTAPGAQGVNSQELLTSVSQIGNNPIKVNVDCPNFYGDERDRLEFKNWFTQFEAVISTRPNWTDEFKVTYLKTKIQKNAAPFIAHLNPAPGNFERCVDALKDQYLDEEYIVDEYFRTLWNESPEFDETYTKSRVYIANVRNTLHNLKTQYEVDLLEEGSSGHKLLSHVVFSKLSRELRQAFARECDSDYPSFSKILEVSSKVFNSLLRNRKHNSSSKSAAKFNPSNHSKPWLNKNQKPENPTLNFAVSETSKPMVLHCRFCNVDGHSNLFCTNFATYQDRVKKCKELKICHNCTSVKHEPSNCPGLKNNLYKSCKFCNSRQHVAALCSKRPLPTLNNACLSTGIGHKSNYLLPVISITMQGRGGDKVSFNALLDTGSSRSYINPKVVKKLSIKQDMVTNVQYEVRTFLGAGTKELGEATLQVYFPSGRYHALPIFIDSNFCVDLEVRGLSQLVSNLRALNTTLGAEFSDSMDKLEINGLIGSDIIQYLDFSTIKCMSGKALKVGNKIIPFGNSDHFLYPGQVGNFGTTYRVENNYKTILADIRCPEAIINTCLDPKATYDDGLGPIFDGSAVERRIDLMISCDSLGIEDNSEPTISDYDKEKIAQFESSIEIRDKVYVDLVWGDNIDQVPSNFSVALAVLDKVTQKLSRKGQLERYNQIFFDQLNEGIIGEFFCDPKHFSNFIWLPHRPVYKNDDQATTKIRAVFNCSLKTSDKPSLNEASYQGINNMQCMLMLIMLFRTNKFVLLGDLRQAFLQIYLKSSRDKNRFCFFVKDGNRLRCFQYNTLLFGYCCSPFILNHVISYIAKMHPDDECSRMISSRFFVDNLVKTGNSVENLKQLYKECTNRLDAVHFDLRSCNSNSAELVDLMKGDDRFIKHGQPLDKVLGYRYSAGSDHLQLHSVHLDETVNSKRGMLSESSKVFDPLSLTGPVTVKAKQLISKLWKRKRTKNHWDETVDGELCKEWSSLSRDLESLSSLQFPRLALTDDSPMDLFFFSDACKSSYGFVAYAVQKGSSNFVFAKAKVAPLQERTLPQLELLGAVVACQGLLTMLEIFKHVKINNVYIHLDAQIVLSWLLSSALPKNNYTCNRVKDVKKMVKAASDSYNVNVFFKYVPTGDNPADMLSRGISFAKFSEQLDLWIHGPSWIRGATVVWPSSEYGCLSEASKSLVMCTDLGARREPLAPVVSFERFSSFTKLLNSTNFVISFLERRGVLKKDTMQDLWGTTDTLEIAKLHLIKTMQAEVFHNELEYLRGPKTSGVPARVRDMNMFLDRFGIIRCDGRMGKVTRFDYDLMYPILLAPKEHALTKSLVLHYHLKVQHLGIQSTLTKIKLAGFRLIHPYQTVKSIINPCFTCKRFNNLCYKYPRMTDLPRDRVNLVRPYSNVGLDYTGHVWVDQGGS